MSLKSLIRRSPLAPVARPAWRGLQRLWMRRPGAAAGRVLPGIVGRVHYGDAMPYDESEEAIRLYLRAARSAMEVLERSLERADRTFDDVRSCLDFGCGHGRVLRLLVQRVPPRRVTACDIDAEGVRFCRAEFGVRGVISSTSVAQTPLRSYDLIWVGSVLTHLRAYAGEELLRVLGGTLSPGGLLVLSAHGQFVLDNLSHFYDGAFADEAEAVRREVQEHGYSFRPYAETFASYSPEGYGMAFHSDAYIPAVVERLFGGAVRPVLFEPRGWDDHHDVFAFQRAS